jgi:hypothetical protein
MTTPESDEHFEHRGGLYMRELADLERAGERATLMVGPFSAMLLIGWIQMVSRNPKMTATERQLAQAMIEQLEPFFAGTTGEEIINRGKHPEFDK